MRELHVVALSEDGRHLVLATRAGTASGEYRLALDERLAAAVRGELPAPGRDAPPSISPRDIQAQLRDGASPEEVAAAAGVPLSRVERYAGPVLAELERMITGARAGLVHRPRLGPSAVPLGEAVETHLAEVAHLAEGSVRWSARRADLGCWVVTVSWTARGRRRTAGWRYDPVTREVVAVDGPSAVLGHVEAASPAGAGRTPRPAAPAPPLTARAAGRTGSAPSAPRSSAAAAGGRAVPAPARTAPAPARADAPHAKGEGSPAATRRRSPAGSAGSTEAAARTAGPGVPARAPTPRAPTTSTSTPRTSTPRTSTPRTSTPRTTAPAADRTQARRAVPRRSAVPPLADRTATTASEPAAAPATPPVLRVVPPAATEQEPLVAPAEPSRPGRRAAGQRSGGRDWADVLMGGAPAPPAAEPRQDQPR